MMMNKEEYELFKESFKGFDEKCLKEHFKFIKKVEKKEKRIIKELTNLIKKKFPDFNIVSGYDDNSKAIGKFSILVYIPEKIYGTGVKELYDYLDIIYIYFSNTPLIIPVQWS